MGRLPLSRGKPTVDPNRSLTARLPFVEFPPRKGFHSLPLRSVRIPVSALPPARRHP